MVVSSGWVGEDGASEEGGAICKSFGGNRLTNVFII